MCAASFIFSIPAHQIPSVHDSLSPVILFNAISTKYFRLVSWKRLYHSITHTSVVPFYSPIQTTFSHLLQKMARSLLVRTIGNGQPLTIVSEEVIKPVGSTKQNLSNQSELHNGTSTPSKTCMPLESLSPGGEKQNTKGGGRTYFRTPPRYPPPRYPYPSGYNPFSVRVFRPRPQSLQPRRRKFVPSLPVIQEHVELML